MRRANDEKDSAEFGTKILAAIGRAMSRTEQAGKAQPIFGEGGERSFRGWLKDFLLVSVMAWPSAKVRIGEEFDVILLDDFDKAVVTIETKEPFHRASKAEREIFAARLSKLPTLRTAYFTNGQEWDRLDLCSPKGAQQVLAKASLAIATAAPEEAESFFTPLRADRHSGFRAPNRSAVTRASPHIMEQLARDLDEAVREMADALLRAYERLETGSAGPSIQGLTRDIFDDWCQRSLQVSVSQILVAIAPILANPDVKRTDLTAELRAQGFTPEIAEETADRLLALGPAERKDCESLRQALADSYRDSVSKLSAQSAHLMLARALLYRIGEDQGLWQILLSGDSFEAYLAEQQVSVAPEPFPALTRLEDCRRRLENVLPTVYQLSDLDWWRVTDDKKIALSVSQRAAVDQCDREINVAVTWTLRMLDGYQLDRVDADVWRNVYQHYLPEDERQRLGGFYTPEVLVEFILDAAGYVPDCVGLCSQRLMDLACGSGAFVNAAAARLLEHLSRPMDCHADLHRSKNRRQEWQTAQAILDCVLSRLHAIDLHPFAAFLTTINLTFLVLPLYAGVKRQNPGLALDVRVYSADSLEDPHESWQMALDFHKLNSRMQLTATSFERYRDALAEPFDLVVGNPPWGGVLKGPLAPVYDDDKKRRFKEQFPNSATGKYDVYGLFMERASQVLRPGGRFALVTQDTFVDKEWARGLRAFLASQTQIPLIVDLNPFGQLFFGRMNTPCVTVVDMRKPSKSHCVAVNTTPVKFTVKSSQERRAKVLATVREAIAALNEGREARGGLASAVRIPQRTLATTAFSGWVLTSCVSGQKFKKNWYKLTDILEPRQGVTPGGCLDVFLMPAEKADRLGLEPDLVHKAIKTRETDRWKPEWQGKVILYPYILENGVGMRAFELHDTPVGDALNFEMALGDRERELRRGRPLDNFTAHELLEYRIGLGLVEFRQVARYLAGHYSRLDGRVFKKKRLEKFGRRWYEYLWPRDPELMLQTARLVSPRLTRHVRFSLDLAGFLADDSCLFLLPTEPTRKKREALRQALSSLLDRTVRESDLLRYCLAFANSSVAEQALLRRRPTPKGYYQVSEALLAEIPVAVPQRTEDAEAILNLVAEIMRTPGHDERRPLEEELDATVLQVLGMGPS
jgi:hypothetical protein